MGTFELKCGARFMYDGCLQEIVRRLPNNCIRLAEVASGAERSVAEGVLMQAACDGTLAFAPVQAGSTAAGRGGAASAAGLDWGDYPPHLRAIAEYRHAVILPLLGSRCSGGAIRARIGEVRAQWAGEGRDPAARTLLRTLSPASVYRWRHRYIASGNDIRALIPRTTERGGKGQRRLGAEEVEAIIGQVLRDGVTRNPYLPIKRLREEVGKRIEAWNAARPGEPPLRVPSWATIQRRVAALPPEAVLAAREGKRAARRQLRQVGEAAEPARPLERVEIDHLVIPVVAIDERDNLPLGLPVLTYALDVATRYPLGYYLGFEPFSYYAVMECLYHAIRPKDPVVGARHGCAHEWLAYGVPRELFTDNGREFKGHDLRDACRQLDTHLRHVPVRTPEFKGTIERHFQRLARDLFSELPGAVFEGLRRRCGYDAIQNACLALGDLDRLLYRWIVDVYAHEPHAGLGGDTPAGRWQALASNPFNAIRRAPGSAEDLQILLSRTATRTVQRYGLDFKALRYNCQELGALRGQQVKLKYHPGDLSAVYVLDAAAEQYLTVPALARQYTRGLTLWTHTLLRERALAARGRVDLAGLRQAREEFEQVIAAARDRKRLNARLARARTGGGPAAGPRDDHGSALPLLPDTPPAAAPARRDALEAKLARQTTAAPGWKFGAPAPQPPAGEGGS